MTIGWLSIQRTERKRETGMV